MFRKAITAWLVCILMSSAGPLQARSPRHHSTEPPPAQTAAGFDYYLLTLSWSPTYCQTHGDDVHQCGSRGFGFVLHGLWPQYDGGGYPQECSAARLTPAARALAESIFPNPRLAAHEWQKHGTCSGLDDLGYFKAADRARRGVAVPGSFDRPVRAFSTTPSSIVAEFTAANPGMPAAAVVVACSGAELAEVRVCLDRNLAPRACGRGIKSHCRAPEVRVPAVR
ncbi:MAG: ribonuclease T2 family protein [Ignavibacteria bacterium]